jgi:hypothetical protein
VTVADCSLCAPQVEEVVAKDVVQLEGALEEDLVSFGRGFTVLEQGVLTELKAEKGTMARELGSVGACRCG